MKQKRYPMVELIALRVILASLAEIGFLTAWIYGGMRGSRARALDERWPR